MQKYDKATAEWFLHNWTAETTITKCEKCGLLYKPSLWHKCKKEHKE